MAQAEKQVNALGLASLSFLDVKRYVRDTFYAPRNRRSSLVVIGRISDSQNDMSSSL
jgi:hypothetical protein